jgi:hypothetical protein
VKKYILSLVTFLYLMLSIGFSMDVHYCMGSRVGVDFFSGKDGKCGKCGMPEDEDGSGCCSNQHAFYKIVESHKHINSYCFSAPSFEALLPKAYQLFTCHNFQRQPDLTALEEVVFGSPPLYLKNRVFRI